MNPGRSVRHRRRLRGLVGITAAIAVLEGLSVFALVSPEYLPAPHDVFAELIRLIGDAEFQSEVLETLKVWGLSMAIATAAGVAVGTALGLSDGAYRATRILLELPRPVPSVVLIPLAILVFGVSVTMAVSLVVYASVWPVIFNTLYGVRGVERTMIDTARAFGVSRARLIMSVVIPAATPSIVTGVRIAASLALIVTITVEVIAGGGGLGSAIASAQAAARPDIMYAAIVVTGILGLLVNSGLRRLSDRAVFWHTSVRSEGEAWA